jgi:hypothetical protein
MLYVAHPVPASYQSLCKWAAYTNLSCCAHHYMHKKIDVGNPSVEYVGLLVLFIEQRMCD